MGMLSAACRFWHEELAFIIVILLIQTVASLNETSVVPRQLPRVPKTPKTTTSTSTAAPTAVRRIATHPPWPNDPTTAKPVKIATHAPWPGDPGYNRATHAPYPFHRDQYGLTADREHLFPSRSTYAPYVYGSSSGSHDAKKKNLLSVFDKDTVSGWAKDIAAYLAAPFMMPSAITNAIGNIPSGLEAETLWGRIAKSLKSALNRRSEERNAAESTADNNNVLKRMKKKLATTGVQSLASLISKRIRPTDSSSSSSSSQSSKSSHESKKKSVDKKFRDLVLSRLVDFLRVRKLPASIHSSKSSSKLTSPSSSSSSAASSPSSSSSSSSVAISAGSHS